MMQPASLLLVDADTRSLETLTFGFEREGCKVSGTSDPGRATQLVRTAAPELAVVALRSADRSALELIGGLRTAAAEDLPVVALGPASLKSDALAAGAADFLALPIFLRDVISVGRLSALESKTGRVGKKAGATAAADELQMRLSEFFGVFYLLRAMAASERSAVLQLTRGTRRAELRIFEGAVISANVGVLQGLPALHHVLLWEEAALSLTRRTVPKNNQLHLSAQEVLDECERFLRDFAHAVRDLGAPRTLYVPAADPEAAMPGLQPSQVTPLLRLFDGHRVLSDVIEESPFRIFDTVRMIRRLRDGGALAARPDGLVREPDQARGPAQSSYAAHPFSTSANRNGSQKSMLAEWAMVPDQRGVVGNRRTTSRRLRPIGGPAFGPVPVPTRAPAATPIPLTTRKGATRSGEIPVLKRKPTPARAIDLANAPTVQVRLDATGMPLSAPLAPTEGALLGGPKTPPVRSRSGSGRQVPLDSEPPPRKNRTASDRHRTLDSEPPPKKDRTASDRHRTLDSEPPPKKDRTASDRHRTLDHEPPPKIELRQELREDLRTDLREDLRELPLESEPAPANEGTENGSPLAFDSEPPPRTELPASDGPLALDSEPPPRTDRPDSGRHAPLDNGPSPRVELTPRPRRTTGGTSGGAPDAFDAIESDFFAREADLYKREALETFDDLDPVGGLPRAPSPRTRKK
jgi:ActR/RegA family two-component response regulator